jgi:hypothetical protein
MKVKIKKTRSKKVKKKRKKERKLLNLLKSFLEITAGAGTFMI